MFAEATFIDAGFSDEVWISYFSINPACKLDLDLLHEQSKMLEIQFSVTMSKVIENAKYIKK